MTQKQQKGDMQRNPGGVSGAPNDKNPKIHHHNTHTTQQGKVRSQRSEIGKRYHKAQSVHGSASSVQSNTLTLLVLFSRNAELKTRLRSSGGSSVALATVLAARLDDALRVLIVLCFFFLGGLVVLVVVTVVFRESARREFW